MRKLFLFPLLVLSAIILLSGISKDSGDDGGGGNLVEEIYWQTVKQNDQLEKIEDGISKFYKKKNEALEKYNSYTSYNNRYYTDARLKAAQITDSAAKQKATQLIQQSENRYRSSLTDWLAQINQLNAKEKELNNLHLLLELMIADPVMQQYQSDNFPDRTRLKEAEAELQAVIEKIKAITR